MDKILKQSLLYDFYGELLTSHQKEIYEDFVLNDLSLSEVAESHQISRQGVHDVVKRCSKQLEEYESKLHLVERFLKIQKKVEEMEEAADRMEEEADRGDLNTIKQEVGKIRTLSQEILDEL